MARSIRMVAPCLPVLLFLLLLVLQPTSACNHDRGRSGPPPDRNSPNLQCPGNIYVENDPFQVNALVSWTEPRSAYDSEDKRNHHVTRSGQGPGVSFSEGTTEVYYSSRDSAGNMAKCPMKITVKVVRCPPPRDIENGYLHCQPSTDFVKGGVCSFGCYEGYRLEGGPSVITCTSVGGSGRWSDSQPSCQRVTCPTLSPPSMGLYNCTDGNNFLSACSHLCPPGFAIPPGTPGVRVCSKYATWRGSPSECRDSEPPVLEGCGLYVELVADKGQEGVTVDWTPPIASDNSRESIVPTLLDDLRPGIFARAGTYRVRYTARDSAGNEALPCEIMVVVKVLMCPEQYPTPYLRTSCPDGVRYGAQCQHSCQGGWALNGTASSTCERSSTSPVYALWDWGRGQPYCQEGRQCPDLPAPVNGAVACDLWYAGKFCQMQCRSGTDFPPLQTRLKEINVCGSSASWVIPVPSDPRCEAGRQPTGTQTYVELSYFTGDCFEEATRQQIRENFIKKLNSSFFREACIPPKCHVNNVEVVCGPVRTKRSANSTLQGGPGYETSISFRLLSALGTSGDKMADYEDAASRSNAFLVAMETNLDLFLAEVVGPNISTAGSRLDRGFPDLDCSPGSFPTYSELACVECSKGGYYDQSNQSCVPCPVGRYQARMGQSSCEACPSLHSTLEPGAASLHQCLALCSPGRWSQTGMEPCSPCARGALQPDYGGTSCLPCPASTATVEEGATHQGACQEFDLAFPPGHASSAELRLPWTEQSRDPVTLTFWLQGAVDSEVDFLNLSLGQDNLLLSLSSASTLRLAINSDVIADNITCNASRWRHVKLVLDTGHVTLLLDSQPHLENVTSPMLGQRSNLSLETEVGLVLGGEGFTGSLTQLHIWAGNVTLPEETAAPQCAQTLLGNVLSWRQMLNATTRGVYFQLPSQCDDLDACESEPCQHGTCQDALHNFSCTCHQGFTGRLCDVNIDDCVGHLCENDGACVDGVMNYTCNCLANYTGAFCDDVIRDGGWGDWGNWSQCSVTCGEGVWQRQRRCDSPLPQNGGLACPGEATETAVCNLTVCPECPEVTAPTNGSWTCEENVTVTRCHVGCDAGFDLDTEPLPEYVCGLETGYEWSFHTQDNPHRRLPNCMPIAAPEVVNMTWQASYVNLTCEGTESATEVRERVTFVMENVTRSLSCVQDNSCQVEEETVTQCQTEGDRHRRSLQTAGILIVLSTRPPAVGANRSLAAMTSALEALNASAWGGVFTVGVGGQSYALILESAHHTSVLGHCDPGNAFVDYYCVPCGPGTYGLEDYCRLCDVGTFQSLPGQRSCLPCPRGWSTLGRGSLSSEECTVPQTSEETRATQDIAVMVGAIVGGILGFTLLVVVAVLLRWAMTRKPKVDPAFPLSWMSANSCGPGKATYRA